MNFLWGGTEGARKIHCVSKEVVCRRKDEGGLGLTPLKVVNTCFLAKWGWNYKKNPNKFWGKVVSSLHSSWGRETFLPIKNGRRGVWSNIIKAIKGMEESGVRLEDLIMVEDNRSERRMDVKVLDWCKLVPLKVNVMAWKANLGRLATKDALMRRRIGISSSECVFCREVDESVEHLFTGCKVAMVVWQAVARWCGLPKFFVFSVQDLVEAHFQIKSNITRRKRVQAMIYTALWCIWKERNEVVFNNKVVAIPNILCNVKCLCNFWVSCRDKEVIRMGAG
ncbi:hypothetical protein SSX86_031232 [Deinandra increscens subsp. villosa]|uniref:Reverse transcriptase zinc-binding domain-containing protein n=1 Tax=Deinandra increscens subsp. villosa TaxID=3103831 RepID=A0AAP0GIX4_9ASTR